MAIRGLPQPLGGGVSLSRDIPDHTVPASLKVDQKARCPLRREHPTLAQIRGAAGPEACDVRIEAVSLVKSVPFTDVAMDQVGLVFVAVESRDISFHRTDRRRWKSSFVPGRQNRLASNY